LRSPIKNKNLKKNYKFSGIPAWSSEITGNSCQEFSA